MKMVQIQESDLKFLFYYTYITMPIMLWVFYRAVRGLAKFIEYFLRSTR